MSLYASNTAVPIDRSKSEIERTLRKYGATEFIYGTKVAQAVIGFRMRDRVVRFNLPMPVLDDMKKVKRWKNWTTRSDGAAGTALDKETRRRWRALSLVIKAKLEAVASGIVLFEEEFLAHFVLPDGKTVGEHTLPRLAGAYESGDVPPLLPYTAKENK